MIVASWGRFNPPTIGHEKLINLVEGVAKQNNATPSVFVSRSYDKKRNPLPYDYKLNLLQSVYGCVTECPSSNIVDLLKYISEKDDQLILIVGSDRLEEFKILLYKYNNKDFSFSKYQVMSAGNRDDSNSIEGISGSKMREFVKQNDFTSFFNNTPSLLKPKAYEIFQRIANG